jgi:hypothetical protein
MATTEMGVEGGGTPKLSQSGGVKGSAQTMYEYEGMALWSRWCWPFCPKSNALACAVHREENGYVVSLESEDYFVVTVCPIPT